MSSFMAKGLKYLSRIAIMTLPHMLFPYVKGLATDNYKDLSDHWNISFQIFWQNIFVFKIDQPHTDRIQYISSVNVKQLSFFFFKSDLRSNFVMFVFIQKIDKLARKWKH
jgi:hypothetical protein